MSSPGCRFCGIGPHCPQPIASGRVLTEELKSEILRRHNQYRDRVRAQRGMAKGDGCIPTLK